VNPRVGQLLPDDWSELGPLIDTLLDAPPDERPAILLKMSAGDERRHAELARMVAECERETPFLARPAGERFATLFDDDAETPLSGTLGGTYDIEREIGRGGMARVYLAHDRKHGRRVAVKVIRSELAASLGRGRFLREIGIAARLRHPNIVPLYDSGDADGVLFFVMPYEEGPSLRARLMTGEPLTVAERIGTLRDVARALAYAHEQGVVHRDVKPDNVMLSGGAAVVTDFGISKAVAAAQGTTAPGASTQAGAGIGTPAYMAPEQAIGDPNTDHRADIYSFGCLAYELFAGNPPFHGMPAHQIIAAHLGEAPPHVNEVANDIPGDVAALVMQCLAKDPAARPSSARDLLIRLDGSAETVVRPSRGRSTTVIFAAGVAVLVAVGGLIATRDRAPASAATLNERSVAVLPLRSLGGDSVQLDLANGLSDEIAIALFHVPGIRVVSRRGAGNYGGQRDFDPQAIGERLGARFLVVGSLREVTGRLVVLIQLIDSKDGGVLWSDRFDREQSELGLVREIIARSVGDTLRRIVGAPAGAASEPVVERVVNPEAYRLYVLAQRALDRRGLSIQASADMFKRATELDTLYANAYSGLSLALALSPFFQPVPVQPVGPEATRAAQRALALDPTLVQPHIALGLVHQHAYDWERAAAEFRTAVDLDGRDVEARVQYGRHLLFRDRPDEALAQFLAARNEDPASALVSSWVSYAYYVRGQLDSAVVESVRAFQNDSTNVTTLALGALVRLKAGRLQESRDFVMRGPPANEVAFYVLAALGDTATAMERVRRLESMPRGRWRTETSRAYVMLGARDTARALTALERATDAHEIWPTLESTRDPIFDPIRASARFQRLLQRVGLR
jgi:serine/threonine protein kinase/tetratricopeptide (TPR) repeat protein